MKEQYWLTRDECLALHDMMLSQHGGIAGVRDENMLESALARPQQIFHYGKPNITELAAAYAAGIIKNHPFLDGNKRTGFVLGVLFLELNGYRFTATEEAATQAILDLAAGKIRENALTAWITENAKTKRRR